MAHKRLTDEAIRRLKPVAGKQPYIFDAICPRLMIRINYGGSKVWSVLHYEKATNKKTGKTETVPRSTKLGTFPSLGVKAAREACRAFELDPKGTLARANVGSFAEVQHQFREQHVGELRTTRDVYRYLDYMVERWGHRPFLEIGRNDVNLLLDEISAKHSKNVADGVLASVSKLMNWFAIRDDRYNSPLVRDMRRSKPKSRERTLDDDEIRALWAAADDLPVFGDFVRLLLLTGQRRSKVAEMRWEDIDAGGTWTIRTEEREKGNPRWLQLPQMALTLIKRQPKIYGNPFVFPGRGGGAVAGFNKRKAAIDAKLPADMPGWTLHDLRRTARTLMSRARVESDHAELVLGHAVVGIKRVYDMFEYRDEKARALQLLADLISVILAPPTDNVIPLKEVAPATLRG